MIKKVGLFIPFTIILIMGLFTIENFYKMVGMDIIDAGYLGIGNILVIFPIMFLIYGIYCAKYGKNALISVIATFSLYMILIIRFYAKYIQFSLCFMSINIFLVSYFMMRMHLKHKKFQ